MQLLDLFESLANGELSNLSMAEGGIIANPSQPKIVLYTNEALLRLYSRFRLKEEDVLLQTYEHITFYHLQPKFAVSYVPPMGTDPEPIRYILDHAQEPFQGDVIRILSVFDNNGCRLPLNDDNQVFSLFTPQFNCLQVPQPKSTLTLSILYQAKHAKLTGVLTEELFVPDILLGALTAFIAYKVFSHMNTQESTSKAQEHIANYEAICADAEDKDLVGTSVSLTNSRFDIRGWV
jgi:hypothetical protein